MLIKGFDHEVMELFKQAPRRHWDSGEKGWRFGLDLDNLNYILDSWLPAAREMGYTVDLDPEVSAYHAALKVEPAAPEAHCLEYRYKLKPFQHQLRATSYLLQRPKFALFMEMGTGKTKATIDAFENRFENGEVRELLVICPSSVVSVWPKELRKHARHDWAVAELLGPREKRKSFLDPAWPVKVINYEGLRVLELELGAYYQGKWDHLMIVADESSRLKSHSAKQTMAACRLGKHAGYKVILTGTPVTQNLMDLWGQFNFLDPGLLGGGSFFAFRHKYGIMGGFNNKQVVGFRNTAALKARVDAASFTVFKQDCLDLPPKSYVTIPLAMGPQQGRVYKEMAKEMVARLGEGGDLRECSVDIILTKLLRLREITSGFLRMDDRSLVQLTDSPKLGALEDMIQSVCQAEQRKLAVQVNFKPEVELIQQLAKRMGVDFITINGDVAVSERGAIIQRFHEDPECRLAILVQQTAGLGIDLTCCHTVVRFSHSWSLADTLQFEDRFHRTGQHHPVTYYDFVCEKSIDNTIFKMLKKKSKLADLILDREDGWAQVITGDIA